MCTYRAVWKSGWLRPMNEYQGCAIECITQHLWIWYRSLTVSHCSLGRSFLRCAQLACWPQIPGFALARSGRALTLTMSPLRLPHYINSCRRAIINLETSLPFQTLLTTNDVSFWSTFVNTRAAGIWVRLISPDSSMVDSVFQCCVHRHDRRSRDWPRPREIPCTQGIAHVPFWVFPQGASGPVERSRGEACAARWRG